MNAVDFTNSIEKVCGYGGSEKKKKIIYNGEVYLLKFPDPIIEKSLLYKNNVFSTYIGCKIFESVNIDRIALYELLFEMQNKNEIICLPGNYYAKLS